MNKPNYFNASYIKIFPRISKLYGNLKNLGKFMNTTPSWKNKVLRAVFNSKFNRWMIHNRLNITNIKG